MRRGLAGARALGLVAALAACGGGDDDGGPPTAEVGTGQDGFVALADGDPIAVIQGPQGGFHVLGSVRVTGLVPGDDEDVMAPDNPTTTFHLLRDGAPIDLGASRYTQGLEPAGDHHQMIGRLVILDITSDDVLAGVEVELEVEVVDVDGRRAGDRRRLIAQPDPANP